MNKILILYPKSFTCYSKFTRKVLNITSKMRNFSFVYMSDDNDFIKKISSDNNVETHLIHDLESDEFTHAIIFDDGEEFPKETNFIKEKSIPLRLIKIAITRVINIKRETEYKNVKSSDTYEYIGRGSYWGNPYSMYEDGDDRDEVIRKFKYDFDFNKFPNKDKSKVIELAGKRLGCFCKPEACHGDILADYLNSLDDGK
ncbi:MAG: DUF4326 domain-containing protein [Erysipelotrichia bacterium]|nr:DUF4326 domain-containing protein [Erysipelotrichia bacterium]